MEIHKEIHKKAILLQLKGRFDTLAAPQFEQQLMAVIDEDLPLLIIDCAQMNYMSSSILRVFLMALKKARAANSKIILTSLQEYIKEVFDLSGFLDLFETYESSEQALASIQREKTERI